MCPDTLDTQTFFSLRMVPNLGLLANRIKERSARAGNPITDQQAINAAWRTRDRMVFEMSTPLAPSAASSAAGGHKVSYGLSDGFSGYYDISNWTIFDGGDSSVNITGVPDSVILNGNNDYENTDLNGSLDLTVVAQAPGVVSFEWSYLTQDESPERDPLQFLLNGSVTNIVVLSGSVSQTGAYTQQVEAGDLFGFRINPSDACCGGAFATISAFSAPITL